MSFLIVYLHGRMIRSTVGVRLYVPEEWATSGYTGTGDLTYNTWMYALYRERPPVVFNIRYYGNCYTIDLSHLGVGAPMVVYLQAELGMYMARVTGLLWEYGSDPLV